MNNVWLIVCIILGVYFLVMVLLNLIPKVTIKSIGWLSLKYITIETKKFKLIIYKVKLTFRLFNNDSVKPFHLEISDLEIHIHDDKKSSKKVATNSGASGVQEDSTSGPEANDDSSLPSGASALEEKLNKVISFTLPKFVYNLLLSSKLINSFQIHLFRYSVIHDLTHKTLQLFLEYSRIEPSLQDLLIIFTVFAINGSVRDRIDPSVTHSIFRAIELTLLSNLVINCPLDRPNKVIVDLDRFRSKLILSRISLPLNSFDLKNKILKLAEERKLQKANTPVVVHKKRPIPFKLIDDLVKLTEAIDFKIEDFKIEWGNFNVEVENFSIKLGKVDSFKYQSTMSKLDIYMSSLKLLEKDYKCLELPSTSYTTEADIVQLLDAIVHLNDPSVKKPINMFSFLTITRPTIDLYHDQVEDLMALQTHHKHKSGHSRRKLDFREIATKLSALSIKLVVVDFIMYSHTRKPDHDKKIPFNRGSRDNFIATLTILSIIHRTYTKEYQNLTKEAKSEKNKINNMFLIKNLRFDALGNSIHFPKITTISSYDISRNEVTVKFQSKALRVKSVNTIIFHLVREFRTRSIINYNQTYNLLATQLVKPPAFLEAEYTTEVPYLDLFKLLPPIITRIRFSISTIQADIICKDGLPSQIIRDEDNNEVDLGNFKRGVCVRLDDLDFTYKLEKEVFDIRLDQFQCFTLSEYANEYVVDFDDVEDYKVSDSEFSEISSVNSTESFPADSRDEPENAGCKRIKRVLSVRDLKLSNATEKDSDVNRLLLSVPEIDGRIDMFFFWCVFYAKSLLKLFAPTVERNITKEQFNKVVGPKKIPKINVLLESIALKLRLPNNVDVLIELDGVRFKNVLISKSSELKNVRLYVVHPATKKWSRLVIIKEPTVTINLTHKIKNSIFRIAPKSIRFNVPHMFQVYTVIDNFITLFKAIKQVNHNFKIHSTNIEDYERLHPVQRHAFELPEIDIKTNVLGIVLENDPFEAELSYIFELGLIEQRERVTKVKLFEKKSAELMAHMEPSEEEKIELTEDSPGDSSGDSPEKHKTNFFKHPLLKIFNGDSNVFKEKLLNFRKNQNIPIGDIYDGIPSVPTNNAEIEIQKAKDILDESISNSWIRKFKLFREVKTKCWRRRQLRTWGNDDVSRLMVEKYDILEYQDGVHLFGAIFKEVDLILNRAKIADLDEFFYRLAKKQPKLVYSLLIPFFIDLKAASFNVFLKDYPLPLAYFPENSKSDERSVHLHGNFVVNERLVKNEDEMRHIFVPFSPAGPKGRLSDAFYSAFIPRTLQSVKFTGELTLDLVTERPCILSWCKSYLSAILSVGGALDNFNKPPVDDSPLGWWDKFSLILHGKLITNVKNELCLHMKSSMNPYALVGEAAGFVFCWKDDACLAINGTDNSRELIQLDSNAFVLGIPNYSTQDKKLWSSFYDEVEDEDYGIDESKRFNKKVVRLSSADRVRWTFGMIYERNKDCSNIVSPDKERTSVFQPHYEVDIRNPAFPNHPDSYTTFRSNYIHMALTVKSTAANGDCFNAGYFTPYTFLHFFYWWHTIHRGVSMPIKRGNLFASKDPVKLKSHVGMGPHVTTVKYLFQFDPLMISHMYMHPSTIDNESRVSFTGLKARFSKCVIDLHQRKQLLTYVNEKLQINSQVPHLKMHRGEINTENADFRLVNAIFNEKSLRGQLLAQLAGIKRHQGTVNQPPPAINNYDEWIAASEVSENDYSWVDAEDFIELEVKEPLSPYPRIQIVSFCTSPKFTYFRELSDHDQGQYPFGNEDSHDCTIGEEIPEMTQADLLSKRITVIKKDLGKVKQKLEAVGKDDIKAINRYQDEVKLLQEKLDVVESIWESFTGESILNAPSLNSKAESGVVKIRTRTLSIYSSRKSEEDMRIANQMDPTIATFRNRFIVHNLQLKWNNKIRYLFTQYLQKVNDRKSSVYFMSKEAIDFVENTIKGSLPTPGKVNFEDYVFNQEIKRGEDVVNDFYDNIEEKDSVNQEAENKYLIKFIHPQIQLVSEKEPDACVIVSSRDLQLRIVAIRKKGTLQTVNKSTETEGLVEQRYGVLFEDSQVLVFRKNDLPRVPIYYCNISQSEEKQWPPWLENEICYNYLGIFNQLIIERNSMGLIYKKPNPLYDLESDLPKCKDITVQLAKIVLNATSEQYSTIYYVVTNLLLNPKSDRDEIYNRLDKVISLVDITDFDGLDTRVVELQSKIREYKHIYLKLAQTDLSETEKTQFSELEFELERLELELSALLSALRIKSLRFKSEKSNQMVMNVVADQVIWHLLDSKREPFVDFALYSPRFSKIDSFDGSKTSKVVIELIQGFNLQEKPIYPELLQPLDQTGKGKDGGKPLPNIAFTWTLIDPVGGIPILQKAKLEVQPLVVQLDLATAKALFSYLFPKDDKTSEVPKAITASSNNLSKTDVSSSAASILSSSGRSKSSNPFKNLMRKRAEKRDAADCTPLSSTSSATSKLENGSGSLFGDNGGSSSSSSSFTKLSRPSIELHTNGRKKNADKGREDDISIIVDRSSKFMSIVDMDISNFNLVVSFHAPPHLKILDVHKLSLNIPNLRYREKLWSTEDIVLHIRKDVIKTILQHTGKILGNKFKVRSRHKTSAPLKQIADFSSFLTVQELQEEGRSRDSSKQNGSAPHPKPHHAHHLHHHEDANASPAAVSQPNFEQILQQIIDEEDEEDDVDDSRITLDSVSAKVSRNASRRSSKLVETK